MALYSGPASAATQRSGIASLTINGEAVDVASDLVYDVTVETREAQIGQSGPQGYSSSYKNGSMGWTVRDSRNLGVAGFMALTDCTIVAVLASGKVVSGDHMWCQSCGEVNTTAGTFPVVFMGKRVEEF